MEIRDLTLPSLNRFASDYLDGKLESENYFHYDSQEPEIYRKRYSDLMNRTFLRNELADYIEGFMASFAKSEAVDRSIEYFRQEDSVVVIGGQQAGLLTGPLYTIHKVISIIKLAEEQSVALGKKVIPVFWIAGEDHDFLEVNHVYALKEGKPAKMGYPLYQPLKTMVTDIELDHEKASVWIEDIVKTYGETEFTESLLKNITVILEKSDGVVNFFAGLIHDWFNEFGLLMLDAADPALRKIESGYFKELISRSEEITEAVFAQQAFIEHEGYKRTLEIDKNAANLFFYDLNKKERILLEWDGGKYTGKNNEVVFTKKELLEIAENSPGQLSNNVVTRPIMQEMLFPVLAFISGPGEIAYWAELKKAFEIYSINMPPIVPRLNITFLERGIATDLAEVGLEVETVLTEGTERCEKAFLESVKDDGIERLLSKLTADLLENHQLLANKAIQIDKGLKQVLVKNRELLQKQLTFIADKIEESTRYKHGVVLNKYKRAANSLFPLGSPQERIWNILFYLNKYGPDFIKDIMRLEYTFNNQHKIIHL